jgi:hypothetical protein
METRRSGENINRLPSLKYFITCGVASKNFLKLNSVALIRERTMPTERPPLVFEVSANFCG